MRTLLKQSKKLLAIVLSLATIITAIPIATSAQTLDSNEDTTISTETNPIQSTEESEILYEVTEKRDSHTKHFRLSNGSYLAVQYDDPVNYQDENGNWTEYDNTMEIVTDETEESTDSVYYQNKSSNIDIKFANKAKSNNMVKIKAEGYQVSWGYQNISKSTAEYKEDIGDFTGNDAFLISDKAVGEVNYKDVYPNVDIQYLSTSTGVKENIILKDNSAQNEFLIDYKIHNLTAVSVNSKSINLINADGKAVYTIEAPYMTDSANTVSTQLSLEIVSLKNNKLTVKLTADKNWLQDSERVYPVTIDPSITRTVSDTLISARTVTSTTSYTSPLQADSSKKVVMNYSLPSLDGAYIEKATLNLFTSSLPNTPVNIKEVTADNGGISYTASSALLDSLLCSYGSTNSFDITKLVSTAYLNDSTSVAVEISTTSSNSITLTNSNITNGQMLIIEYNNFEGIDPNISYHTQDIGRAGTSYLNDITGNLLLTRTDIGTDGNVLPVSIDMVYNRKNIAADYLLAEPYGRGWNCGYYYRLQPMTSDNCDYYLVDASGRKIFFTTEDDEIWTDEDGEGYELTFATEGSLLNATITTPNGEIFTVDTYGRVVKIGNQTFKDNGLTNSITITYYGAATSTTGNRITRITDGVGRKYNFVYSSGRLSKINYVGTGTTVLSSVSYTYSQYLTSGIYRLTGVSYTGGSSVSYAYDSGSSLIKATDVDGYSISFNGSTRVNSINETSASNTAGGTLNMVYGGNRTVFYDNNGNYEYMYFDTQGNTTSVRDEKGNAVFAEYGGRGELNKISDSKNTNADFISDNNLIQNGDLTVSNISTSGTAALSTLTNWTFNGTTSSDKVIYASGQTAIPNYDYSRVMIYGDITTAKTMTQTVSVENGTAGDEYSFGGWSIGNALPLHSEIAGNNRAWGMTLETIASDGTATEIGSFNYDSNDTSWQYLRSDATAQTAYTSLRLTVKYSNQANSAYFDGIELVKTGTTEIITEEDDSSTEDSEDTTEEEVEEPTFNSNGIKTYTNTSEDGVTTNESVDRYENSVASEITYGTKSISTANGYSSDGNYQTSQTDEAGNQTNYTYNTETGLLTSVTDANNAVTNYTYNSAGQLTASSCGNTSNSYTYENDRLKTITTNSQSYYFTYDEWGNQTGIKVGQNETDATSLITYVYETVANGGKLSNITYGNNQIIAYTYDNEDKPTAISINGVTRYTLQYEYGELKSITNLELNRKIVYTEDGTEQWDVTNNRRVHYTSDSETDGYVDHFLGNTFSRKSTYNDDGSTTVDYKHDGTLYAKQTLTYDAFDRLTADTVKSGEDSDVTQLNVAYTYRDINSSKTTNQISSITYTSNHSSLSGSNAKTISYTYNDLGYISSVTDSSGTTSYYYDEKGQLTRVDDAAQNLTFTYLYNAAGNVTTSAKYSFGSVHSSNMLDMYMYSYNSVWKDKLTYAKDVGSITYDAIGNPLTYGSNTFTWTAGRQLESVTNTDNTITYKYDANGIRQQKIVNGEKTEYIYSEDGKLLKQTDAYGNEMYFHYDEDGAPVGLNYYGAEYVYLKNAQGDIIGLTTPSGRLAAEYKYDAWGKLLSVTGSMASSVGTDNPLRYRGYYYDNETGYYYLQSRYYNPTVGRFINADDTNFIGSGETELSNNLFAYCGNNPVNMADPTGYVAIADDVLLVSAFAGLCFSVIMLCAYMSTPEFRTSWARFCTAVGNGLSSIGTSIYRGGQAAWNWSKAKIKSAISALTLYIAATKADAKIRTKIKKDSHTYFEAYRDNATGIVTIGKGITQAKAVLRLKSGKNVFTKYSYNARKITALAGSATPMYHNKHKNAINYYKHYHVSKHKNSAHCFYLI